jgi:hypothetical protein
VSPQTLHDAVKLVAGAGTDEQRDDGAAALDLLATRGLVRRAGSFVLQPFALRPRDWLDLLAWTVTADRHKRFLGEPPGLRCTFRGETFSLLVCHACTSVFRPKRKGAGTRHCDLCSTRPAAPPLGKDAPPMTVRVPAHMLTATVVGAWGMVTLRRCAECKEWMHAQRKDARVCSTRCESRRRRRVGG